MNLPTKDELDAAPPFKSHTSLGLLTKAVDTQKQRAVDYNATGGERSMQHTVNMFNAITQRTVRDRLSESDGWLFMMCLKLAREAQAGDPYDSLLDLTSYSALYGESRLKEAAIATSGPEPARVSDSDVFRERLVETLLKVKKQFGRDAVKAILVYGAGAEKVSNVPDDKIANVLGICEILFDAAKSSDATGTV